MDLKLPNLGEGADSGTVITVFVKDGDRIEKDQPVIELENEKAVATIPSTASGVVSKVFVKSGDKISAGQSIISISDDGAAPAPKSDEPEKAAKQPAAKEASPQPAEEKPAETHEEAAEPAHVSNGEVKAGPALRKMAADLGIDLGKIRGTGRGGQIVIGDVRAYIDRLVKGVAGGKAAQVGPAAKPAAERIDFSKWGEISKKPMSSLRKVIARRMVENWNAIPHVTQFDEADVTHVLELRKKYADAYEKQGVRLTLTPFILKAVIATLKRHPIFNSSMDEAAEEIVYKEYFNIGIAVDTDAGLIVPVIHDAGGKKMVELAKDLDALAKKARDRKVSTDELKGGTFTVSNQGGIGGGHFTPIVNKPEVAILGLGRGVMKPVVRESVIETRMMLPIAISYDHRVIDGGNAARFTVDLVAAIQEFKEEEVKI